MAKKRAKRRKASAEKLKERARRKARQIIRARLAGGKSYGEMTPAEKVALDKRFSRISSVIIDRIATRQLPGVRRAEMERLAAMRSPKTEETDLNDMFENLIEDLQLEGRNYFSGLSKSTSAKRAAHFKKGASMDDDNPAAYKPAPGDARAETKPSKYTKRYHQLFTKEGVVKHDKRFKFNRQKENPYFKEDINLLFENEEGIRKKAKETGISYGILKKVFDRGVAAWRTGHRPGTTPSQWGFARINSFATGGKTRTTADADLWRQHKGKSENFLDDAAALMEQVESYITEQTAVERTRERIKREKEVAKMRHSRMLDTARETDRAQQDESVDKTKPENREQGTDSLVKIYKDDTPGEIDKKNESYYADDIPSSYGTIKRGDAVRFTHHSMDMADDDSEKEGTVVGSTLQHLRVRDSNGILYLVRHADAELIE